MTKVGAQRAAEITGISKSTIQRAMKSGKLSFTRNENGHREIDVSELERVYGLKAGLDNTGASVEAKAAPSVVEQEMQKASTMIEMERMKMRIYMLEQQLETAHTQIDDLKEQRDQWQKQASQVLITSEYSQRQAEELKEKMRQREERARALRQKRDQQQAALGEKMKNMRPQNQNSGSFVDNSRSYVDLAEEARQAEIARNGGLMSGFLKRLRGAA
jgi:chromosome segregation ATPase